MDKAKRRGRARLLIQVCFAALSNGYLRGFTRGDIYAGAGKLLCAPGMNCYSCPGALLSCPIGALQATLSDGAYRFSLYVAGMMTVFGAVFGRAVCGFLCPFGLVQDLLYKIPFFKKLRRLPGERFLRALRYVVLGLTVILLPMLLPGAFGVGVPYFCKFICPVGMLEGGVVLSLLNEGVRAAAGLLFAWKLTILVALLLLSMALYRPFCRYLCPLGALYGLFNRFALYRYALDESACTRCGACVRACPMTINVLRRPNSADCVRCGACLSACETGALHALMAGRARKNAAAEQNIKA